MNQPANPVDVRESPDVIILAGGEGTRIRAYWSGPACLAPVNGRPILFYLMQAIYALGAKSVTFMLGYRGEDVKAWLNENLSQASCPAWAFFLDEGKNTSAWAVRKALQWRTTVKPHERPPVLVLHGNHLPLYDLGALVRFHASRHGAWATAALTPREGEWSDAYAGGAVLGPRAAEEIGRSETALDFESFLVGALRFPALPGFLSLATPAGFRAASRWRP